jgi:hypothetical protein
VLWLLFAAPIVGLFVFDFVMHTARAAEGRYAIAALPIACVLGGAGLACMSGRARTLVVVLILVAWAPNTLLYKRTAKRVTARNRAEIVSSKESPGDLVLVDGIPSGLLNVVRYLKGSAPIVGWMPSWLDVPGLRQQPETIAEFAAGRSRIWWVEGAGCPPVAPEREWLRANAVAIYETKPISLFVPKDAATF